MRILFTGASSFTGFWFVKSLSGGGHEIVCSLTRELVYYTGMRRQRLDLLEPHCKFAPRTAFGSDAFLRLMDDRNFDLLCHHAADVTNYKSSDFDALAALQNNTRNLRQVLAAMKSSGLQAVVLTGTVFENDEGTGSEPIRAFSPYGLSKGLTGQYFRYYCHEAGVKLGKFVIPNPFGPFEEPRFTAYLMYNWRAGKMAEVKTPDYLRDNIHVDLLGAAYADFCGKAVQQKTPWFKSSPSGYPEKQGEFAQRVAREIRQRLGWECRLELVKQLDFGEPMERTNTEPMAPLFPHWSESKAWDGFTEFYTNQV